jgi:hypothetical protein
MVGVIGNASIRFAMLMGAPFLQIVYRQKSYTKPLSLLHTPKIRENYSMYIWQVYARDPAHGARGFPEHKNNPYHKGLR